MTGRRLRVDTSVSIKPAFEWNWLREYPKLLD